MTITGVRAAGCHDGTLTQGPAASCQPRSRDRSRRGKARGPTLFASAFTRGINRIRFDCPWPRCFIFKHPAVDLLRVDAVGISLAGAHRCGVFVGRAGPGLGLRPWLCIRPTIRHFVSLLNGVPRPGAPFQGAARRVFWLTMRDAFCGGPSAIGGLSGPWLGLDATVSRRI